MNKILVVIPFLAFLSVSCDNPVGPTDLSIDPQVVYLNVGQSQVFKISGLNGSDFRVFTRFYQGEPVCYFDCDPDIYGDIERLSSGSMKYTLRKGKNPAKEKIIQLEVYPSDSNDYRASALIYIN